jgi:hypothetical protein
MKYKLDFRNYLGSECETNFDFPTVFFTFHNVIECWRNAHFCIYCFQWNPTKRTIQPSFKILNHNTSRQFNMLSHLNTSAEMNVVTSTYILGKGYDSFCNVR